MRDYVWDEDSLLFTLSKHFDAVPPIELKIDLEAKNA